jgi:carboxylate-amine ligase
MTVDTSPTTQWSVWKAHPSGADYTLGVEEEVMLLHPHDWSLAQQSDRVLKTLPPDLSHQVTPETHRSALELATGVHGRVEGVGEELSGLRQALASQLALLGLRAAVAGTHPFTVWQETVVSEGSRYEAVYSSMRELARREPTFALHVHVGVRDPEDAIRTADRLRAHIPLLLALSANSPFWQGRNSGFASMRTPLFQAFPRVGIPRAFGSYDEYVTSVEQLLRSNAMPEPTFLWWDVRPQPSFGTVEVRIMDAQWSVERTLPLVALVQCLARLEREEGYASSTLLSAPEVLEENRFLASRDGVDAMLILPGIGQRVPVRVLIEEMLPALYSHAQDLRCDSELMGVSELIARPSAARQVEIARRLGRLPGLVDTLAAEFAPTD